VGGQRQSPAALPPVKTQYPLYRRLIGPQDRSGRMRKILSPTGIRSQDRPARNDKLYRLRYPCSQSPKQSYVLSFSHKFMAVTTKMRTVPLEDELLPEFSALTPSAPNRTFSN
jgi:hypothetical protein